MFDFIKNIFLCFVKELFLRQMKRKLETTNTNRRKLVTKIISIMERDLVHQYHHKQKPKKEMENNGVSKSYHILVFFIELIHDKGMIIQMCLFI
jgi:hypothetical protein